MGFWNWFLGLDKIKDAFTEIKKDIDDINTAKSLTDGSVEALRKEIIGIKKLLSDGSKEIKELSKEVYMLKGTPKQKDTPIIIQKSPIESKLTAVRQLAVAVRLIDSIKEALKRRMPVKTIRKECLAYVSDRTFWRYLAKAKEG